jgi:LysR substrate binding domain
VTDGPDSPRPAFTVAFVPGVTPDKWARAWAERVGSPLDLLPVAEEAQTAVLYDGRADMSLVRLPVDNTSLHAIPLYREVPVVVAPKGHFVEAADEVTLEDLAGEHVHQVPPLTVEEAITTVAAGVGVVVVPMSLARLHNRKDVVHRPVIDAPESPVGLVWRNDRDDDRFEAFIGVVRGRTPNSTRGGVAPSPPRRGGSTGAPRGGAGSPASRGRPRSRRRRG